MNHRHAHRDRLGQSSERAGCLEGNGLKDINAVVVRKGLRLVTRRSVHSVRNYGSRSLVHGERNIFSHMWCIHMTGMYIRRVVTRRKQARTEERTTRRTILNRNSVWAINLQTRLGVTKAARMPLKSED